MNSCLTGLFAALSFMVALVGSTPLPAEASSDVFRLGVLEVGNPFQITQPQVLPDQPTVSDHRFSYIDAGSSFACGIRMGTHQIECWGLNDFGQSTPPEGQFRSLSLGEFHGCAIRDRDSHLTCWGLNKAFMGVSDDHEEYLSVSSGDYHTCAITKSKNIKCFGSNSLGQSIAPKGHFSSVSAKAYHTCATRTDGRLSCWGDPGFLEYGVPAGKFKEVATGRLHGCALAKTQGSVICWGNNLDGEVDRPEGRFRQIAAGSWHTCGLRDDRAIRCKGEDIFGQTSWTDADTEVGVRYKQVAAGGEMTCGLTVDGHLKCHGSFAFNSGLFDPEYQNAKTQNLSRDNALKPRWFLLAAPLIANFVGMGLQTYGKAADKKGTVNYEARNQKFQWGLMGVASALNFIAGSGPNPILTGIQELQKDVESLRVQVDAMDLKLSGVVSTTSKMWCDQAIASQRDPIVTLKTAKDAYLKLISGKVLPAFTDAILKKSPLPDPVNAPGGIKEYLTKYEAEVREAMTELDVSFASTTTPAVEACRSRSLDAWRAKASHPFDDRLIYEKSYALLNDLLIWETEGLVLLQDINLWKAYIDLTGDGPIKKVAVDPNNLDGLCADIREKSINTADPSYSRYAAAKVECDENSNFVKKTYINMVKSVEATGAPYTDDTVILSLSEKQWNVSPPSAGNPDSRPDRNWLWLRNYSSDLAGTNENTGVGQFDNYPAGASFQYYIGRGKGTWYSDGQAWLDVFQSSDVYRSAKGIKGVNDLISLMEDTPDSFVPPAEAAKAPIATLFKNVKNKVFTIGRKTFEWDFSKMLGLYDTWHFDGGAGCGGFLHQFETAYCVAGSLLGRLCSSSDEAKLFGSSVRTGDGTCTWNGTNGKNDGYRVTTTPQYWNKGPIGAAGQIGNITFDYSYSRNDRVTLSNGNYLNTFLWEEATIFKNKPSIGGKPNVVMWMMMPVLNVDERTCTSSMVINYGLRNPSFIENGVRIKATRCGNDMDEVVRSLVPRPEYPEIPEIRP